MTAALKRFTDDKLKLQVTSYTEMLGLSDICHPNVIFWDVRESFFARIDRQ